MAYVIPFLVFVCVWLLCMGGYYIYLDQKAVKKQAMLRRAATAPSLKQIRRLELKRQRKIGMLERLISHVMDVSTLGDMLAQSGLALSLDAFLLISSGLGAGFSLAGFLMTRSFLMFVIMAVAGFALPVLVVAHKKRKRNQLMVSQLPNTMDFIVRALKSGQSLDRALYGVSTNMAPPISTEIRLVYDELSMGLAFAQALRNFEKRFPKIPEIKFLCTSFIIQKETGGNLTQILESLSHTLRSRFKLGRQIRAITAEGRLSMFLLGLAPFGFSGAIYLVNPGYMSILLHDPKGQHLLITALVLNVTGFLVMRLLTKVDV